MCGLPGYPSTWNLGDNKEQSFLTLHLLEAPECVKTEANMRVGMWAVISCVGLAGAGYGVMSMNAPDPTSEPVVTGSSLVDINLPATLSTRAQIGQNAFASKCAACHGENAVGQEGVAPPLVHIIYEPSHHGDESFQRAVAQAVRGHHWPFGNMPPVEGLTRAEVAMIVAYVRELQVANGIH
jgi:mono/diheme cytochrome c family protein